MNLSIYGVGDAHRRTWLAVDLGVSFAAEEHLPGVDLICPMSAIWSKSAKIVRALCLRMRMKIILARCSICGRD